jgi:hypothetical protein
MSWVQTLQNRWKVKSGFQVLLILLVFACTGFTVLLIKRPLFFWWFPDGDIPTVARIAYWILILPVYNVFLLCYGFLFGQFDFFWNFEKRFFNRMLSIFKKTE